MSEFLTKTGQQRVSFGEYDTTNAYKMGDSIIYDGNVWVANDNIPANTAFTPGSSGATWSSKVTGIPSTGLTNIANGNSNVSIPSANGNVNISSEGNANVAVITGTGANIAGTLTATGNVSGGNLTTGGVLSVTGNANVGNLETSGIIVSSIATGTAPFTVTSTTPVANLSVATAATVTANAQPNITSIGQLTTLNVSGNVSGSRFVGIGFDNGTSNITIQANGEIYHYIGGNATSKLTVRSSGTTSEGSLTVANGIATLGPVGNVRITGGSNGQVLTTNGSGLLSWETLSPSASVSNIANGTSNVSIPSANGNVLISSAGNANIAVITGTGVNINGTLNATDTLNVTGNANVGNLGVATVLATSNVTSPIFLSTIGTGTPPFVVTSTTQVANLSVATAGSATTAGTVTTAAQPNITSVGTLSSLSVTNAISTPGILNGNSNITITANGSMSAYIGGNANARLSIAATGLQTNGIVVSGQSNLGAVGNVVITGGSNGQFLRTDGAGNLTWAAASVAAFWALSTRTSGNVSYTGSSNPTGVDMNLGTTTFQNTSNNITYGTQVSNGLRIEAKVSSTNYLITAYINLSRVDVLDPSGNLTFNWVDTSNNILATSIPLIVRDQYAPTYPTAFERYGTCSAIVTVSGSAQTFKLRVTSNPANVNWIIDVGTGLTVTEI